MTCWFGWVSVWLRGLDLRFGFAVWICGLDLRFGFAVWICGLDLRFGLTLLLGLRFGLALLGFAVWFGLVWGFGLTWFGW